MVKGMKRKYLSNTFCMLGVALIATAIFKDQWLWGTGSGLFFLVLGYKLDYEAIMAAYYITLLVIGSLVYLAAKRGWIK